MEFMLPFNGFDVYFKHDRIVKKIRHLHLCRGCDDMTRNPSFCCGHCARLYRSKKCAEKKMNLEI